jgi:hypothetical protein
MTKAPLGASYVVGVPLLSRLETAVRSWAGANGLASMTLFGTPLIFPRKNGQG